MQVASILSDLTSLRVCVSLHPPTHHNLHHLTNTPQDPAAAQTLVSAGSSQTQSSLQPNTNDTSDPDLQRAKDLVDLHNNVKVRLEERGLDAELERLRVQVEVLVRGLDRR